MATLSLQQDAVQKMLAHLGSVYPLDNELITELQTIVRFEKVQRKTLLLKPGQLNDRMYYVHKGLLRCFYYKKDEDGDDTNIDISTWFMRELNFCVSVESYYEQLLSYEYIEALEPCELLSISYAEAEAIYLRSFAFNYIGRVLTIKYLVEWVRQLRNIRRLKAEERYAALRKADPELVQRVPQKYLASYLDLVEKSVTRARGK